MCFILKYKGHAFLLLLVLIVKKALTPFGEIKKKRQTETSFDVLHLLLFLSYISCVINMCFLFISSDMVDWVDRCIYPEMFFSINQIELWCSITEKTGEIRDVPQTGPFIKNIAFLWAFTTGTKQDLVLNFQWVCWIHRLLRLCQSRRECGSCFVIA